MRAYFPLPPSISIDGIQDKIIGSITFLNSPNNRLKPILFNKRYKDIVYLGIYLFTKKTWTLLEVKECQPFNFLEMRRDQFEVGDNEMLVVVVKKIKDFKEIHNNLPEPDILKIDNSIIEQRVSMNFSFLESTSSYQGDYPVNIAMLKQGSLLTFDTLKDSSNSSVKNFFILMNISKNNLSSKPEKIKIFNPENKEKFEYLNAYRNSFTIIDINIYENLLDTKKTIFLISKTCSFIPIMLSVNLKTHQLSVEHTHPPSEYFSGQQKLEFMQLIKKTWI